MRISTGILAEGSSPTPLLGHQPEDALHVAAASCRFNAPHRIWAERRAAPKPARAAVVLAGRPGRHPLGDRLDLRAFSHASRALHCFQLRSSSLMLVLERVVCASTRLTMTTAVQSE